MKQSDHCEIDAADPQRIDAFQCPATLFCTLQQDDCCVNSADMFAAEPPEPPNAPGPDQSTVTQSMSPEEIAGAVIGCYHLLQKIGERGHGRGLAGRTKNPSAATVASHWLARGYGFFLHLQEWLRTVFRPPDSTALAPHRIGTY
jgi:hypothetical protein